MAFEEYVYSGTKRLRRGYTTGTCAALAAKAATVAALTGSVPDDVSLLTPKGLRVTVEVLAGQVGSDAGGDPAVRCAACSVVKDAGDDYDVTDGAEVRSTVTLREPAAGELPAAGGAAGAAGASGPSGRPRVSIDGGRGVGRVTRPGLDQPVGNAAINSVPRRMIAEAVLEVLDDFDSPCSAEVVVEVPGGDELAKKTFNPHIGIEGGISILGTSGIVEPRSLEALKDSLTVEIRAAAAQAGEGGGEAPAATPRRLVITPGNYGEDFLGEERIAPDVPVVKCANFIGHALDRAAVEGFAQVLVVGHIGKLVKVAGGIMDTHSRTADCRCEVFAAHAALQGAGRGVIERIMAAATTDACLDIVEEECGPAAMEATVHSIARAIQERLERRAAGAYEVGAITFSNKRGTLAVTAEATALLQAWENEDESLARRR